MNPGIWIKEFFRPLREEKWNEFPKHYLRALAWIVILVWAAYETLGAVKGFDMGRVDNLLRVHNTQTSDKVTIVEIGEKDYQQIFQSHTPLCSDGLAALVARVRSYRPAVIGVDLETSDPASRCSKDEENAAADLTEIPEVPVIWAEVPRAAQAPLEVAPVLGLKLEDAGSRNYQSTARPKLEDLVGIPRFPVDSDGLVRRYEGGFDVTGKIDANGASSHPLSHLPSLARAVVDAKLCADAKTAAGDSAAIIKCPVAKAPNEPVIFNFYGDRYQFPVIAASQLGNSYGELSSQEDRLPSNPQVSDVRRDLLQGRIVLIGATYRAADDFYPTPIGSMTGVQLNALAVQSDLSGGGIQDEQRLGNVVADFVFGSLVVLIFFAWARRPRRALAVAAIGLSAAAISLSVVLFHTSSYFLRFMPVMVGMALQQTIELAHQAGHLREELAARTNEVGNLSREKQILNDKLALTDLLWESRERDRDRDKEVKAKARGAGGR